MNVYVCGIENITIAFFITNNEIDDSNENYIFEVSFSY